MPTYTIRTAPTDHAAGFILADRSVPGNEVHAIVRRYRAANLRVEVHADLDGARIFV